MVIFGHAEAVYTRCYELVKACWRHHFGVLHPFGALQRAWEVSTCGFRSSYSKQHVICLCGITQYDASEGPGTPTRLGILVPNRSTMTLKPLHMIGSCSSSL